MNSITPKAETEDKKHTTIDKEYIISRKIKIVKNIIYFLISGDNIVYIGKSKNGINRIKKHIQQKVKIFDSYWFFEINKGEMDKIEKFYIKKFMPVYNVDCKDKIKEKILDSYEWLIGYNDYGFDRS